jgi:hypothetical protein
MPLDAFQYTVTINSSGADYIAGGVPIGQGSGDKDYCSVPDAVVRFQADTTAGNSAPTTDALCTGGNYSPL